MAIIEIDQKEIVIPTGWELIEAAKSANPLYWLLLCKRTKDGMYVTWEYNSQSLCYWGHYEWSATAAELEFRARLESSNL